MKQVLILSGKGGTGKTTVSAGLIHLLQSKSYGDCDVDAPNLHLLATPSGTASATPFYGLPKAAIDPDLCTGCGLCRDNCRFGAISPTLAVNAFLCEGCGVCNHVCPVKSIRLTQTVSGETTVYHGDSHFSTAILKTGSGASGKLVTQVKQNMTQIDHTIAIIDGSPGIGCPVIASVSGVDLVVLVTEPTVSGISDFLRILKTVQHFAVPCLVCINKFDLHLEKAQELEALCQEKAISVIGKIPYDTLIQKATNQGKTIVEFDSPASAEIRRICNGVTQMLANI